MMKKSTVGAVIAAMFAVVILVILAVTVNQQYQTTSLKKPELLTFIYSYGKNQDFLSPTSVAVSPKGEVYVVDSQANRIIIYDSKFKFVSFFGEAGSNPGQLSYPLTVAIDKQGRVYISEIVNHRVQVFSPEGKFLAKFPKDSNLLKAPTALAVDKDDKIYVFDKNDQRIKVFNSDGHLLNSFGGDDSEQGPFYYAMGLAVSSVGEIFVSDSGNARIQVYSRQGKFLREVKPEKEVLSNPRGIALDEKGSLYISDSLRNTVFTVTQGDFNFNNVRGFEGFSAPDGITIYDHRLYVADKGNKRVAVFEMPR
jgi:DNA-binding beta-propeller fold protein YncE